MLSDIKYIENILFHNKKSKKKLKKISLNAKNPTFSTSWASFYFLFFL